VWIEALNGRADRADSPPTRLAYEMLLPLATASVALWIAGAPGRQGLGHAPRRIAATVVGGLLVFAGGTWLLTAIEEADPMPFWFHVARCTAFITAFAAAPFALAMWAYGRSFVASASWRTSALGLACGATGAFTMSFVCETETAAHVIVGHGLAMLVGAVAGALAARRVTRA
jgi:hypothetical protein